MTVWWRYARPRASFWPATIITPVSEAPLHSDRFQAGSPTAPGPVSKSRPPLALTSSGNPDQPQRRHPTAQQARAGPEALALAAAHSGRRTVRQNPGSSVAMTNIGNG